MVKTEFTFLNNKDMKVQGYKWINDVQKEYKGIIQIAHGMSENAERYDKFAQMLTNNGYIVYANDHRGHGRTAKSIESLGDTGVDGFEGMVLDMKQLNEIIRTDNPELPIFLFGHSLGSFLVQNYIIEYSDSISGIILSGTSGPQGIKLYFALMLAKLEVFRIGLSKPSKLLNKLSFGNYNNSFKPVRTDFDWLSSENEEVDLYINNPFCGFVMSAAFFEALTKGLIKIHNKNMMEKISKKLSIYIFSGDKDPVSNNIRTIKSLIDIYKSLGINDISFRFYKDGRHEMLNETNRDEVMEDVISWLKVH